MYQRTNNWNQTPVNAGAYAGPDYAGPDYAGLAYGGLAYGNAESGTAPGMFSMGHSTLTGLHPYVESAAMVTLGAALGAGAVYFLRR